MDSIERYYNQARHWPDTKLDRYLLARSGGADKPMVLSIILAKISRILQTQNNKQQPQNVLEDPEDLLKYLVQELFRCSDSDKEVTIQILFSIADRYLNECEKPQEKTFQAILRACAKICQTYTGTNLRAVTVMNTLEKLTNTQLNWNDVAAFGKGESLMLGVHFEEGQKLSCNIRCQVMNGYAVVPLSYEHVSGILKTDKKLDIGSWVDAYFVSVAKDRAFLTLTPPTPKDCQQ